MHRLSLCSFDPLPNAVVKPDDPLSMREVINRAFAKAVCCLV